MSAALLTCGEYSAPAIVDHGSIYDNTLAAGVFVGLSAAAAHCNSGRGNLSEPFSGGDHSTDSTTLINPHEPHGANSSAVVQNTGNGPGHGHGGRGDSVAFTAFTSPGLGPGDSPSGDCDPGNSGAVNAGGD